MGSYTSKTKLSVEDMTFLQAKTQLDQASIQVHTVPGTRERLTGILAGMVRGLSQGLSLWRADEGAVCRDVLEDLPKWEC